MMAYTLSTLPTRLMRRAAYRTSGRWKSTRDHTTLRYEPERRSKSTRAAVEAHRGCLLRSIKHRARGLRTAVRDNQNGGGTPNQSMFWEVMAREAGGRRPAPSPTR